MIETRTSFDRICMGILWLGILFILAPLWIALMTASHSAVDVMRSGLAWYPGPHLVENVIRVFTDTRIPVQMFNSLVVALMTAVGICILSFCTAFALVFLNLRFGWLVFATIFGTILLPVDIRVVPTYQVMSNIMEPFAALGLPVSQISLVNTHIGLALPAIAHGTGTFMLRQFFRTVPMDLARAARMDGAGALRFMWDVLLPLSRPALAALFVLMFLGGWTNYLWPLVASSTADMQTAVVGLARLATDGDSRAPDFPLMMAAASTVSLIPLTLIAVLQRFLVRGMALTEK